MEQLCRCRTTLGTHQILLMSCERALGLYESWLMEPTLQSRSIALSFYAFFIVKPSKCSNLCLIFRCGCDECVTSRQEDSLRHSRSRINAYRALASPSLIALSSKDPILTAFELSWELRRLSFMEHEFKVYI